MNIHTEILAKSEKNGNVSLYRHLKDTAEIAINIAFNTGLDPQTAYIGAVLHDIGKASSVFQKRLRKDTEPGTHFRHEVASLLFVSFVDEKRRGAVIEMIAGHHKSVWKDISELGLLDMDENEDCFKVHSKGFGKWMPVAIDILKSLSIDCHKLSLMEARQNYDNAVIYCRECTEKYGYSIWRGLLMAADHMASALEETGSYEVKSFFALPDLSFYDRKNRLYPLSLIDTDDNRPYTLVTAPTGAGKTDFLMRRCRGRVFYVLPYQASINAMYERIKNDLADTDAQVSLLHSASDVVVGEENRMEQIMQHMVGSSVKVMTPHQLASVVFGIKGYESMILDLKGCDVILDEIHTYSDTIQAVVLRIIEILVSLGCRIHIGTATMPTVLYDKIISLLGGRNKVYEVSLHGKELDSFDRHRVYKIKNMEGSFDIIEEAVKMKQKVLIVCNQVGSAQDMYGKVISLYPQVKKMLIHSRFRREDRNSLENLLKGYLNNLENEPCIVISTQVVEVSLDISFDVMVTECAPIDSLIQRFGRINRKRNYGTIGTLKPVYVVEPPENEKAALPYRLEILDKTYSVLPDNGAVLHESDTQKLIDSVYTDLNIRDIDTGGTVFNGEGWQLRELCNNPRSVFLQSLDINTATCITESDKENYIRGDRTARVNLEIPVSYRAVAYRGLERLNVGTLPYIIPDDAYATNTGIIMDKCTPDNYKQFEII